FYEFDERHFFDSDGASPEIAERRRSGFTRLAATLAAQSPDTIGRTGRIAAGLSDLQFTTAYRVPFPFRRFVDRHLKIGSLLSEADGVQVADADGRSSFDLAGSYGVNLFGYDFYKECIDSGIERVRALGPLLGSYHPIVEDNVRRLQCISGMDEISFHMSGT